MEKNGASVCQWNEWEGLSDEQRNRELYKVLKTLDDRTKNIMSAIRVYAFSGGVVGGAVAVCSIFGAKAFLF